MYDTHAQYSKQQSLGHMQVAGGGRLGDENDEPERDAEIVEESIVERDAHYLKRERRKCCSSRR